MKDLTQTSSANVTPSSTAQSCARPRLVIAALFGIAGAFCASTAAAETAMRVSSFEYQPSTGLLIEEKIEPDIAALTLTTTYTYDAFGNNLSATAGGQAVTSRSTSSTYDARGQFAIISTNALGQSESIEYDAKFGVPVSKTGPNGLTTTWTYDGFGRKTLETRPDDTQTSWTYLYCQGVNGGTQSCPQPALSGYVVTETPLAADGTSPNGPIKKTYYDKLDRVIAAEVEGFDGSSTIRTITTYDAAGRQKEVSKPHFVGDPVQMVTTTYDALGRPTKVKQPDNSESTFTYQGLTTTETNSLTQTKTTVRNSRGLTISVTDDMGGVTNYAYDAFDNLKSITDPALNVSTMTYDIRGRKIAANDPDMGSWLYSYNVFGELISQTDAKFQVTTVTYDLLGRMIQRVEPGLTSDWVYGTSSGNKNVGKLVSATTSDGYERTHTYDSQGRPSTTAIKIDGVTSTFSTFYDAHSRVSQVFYPSGFIAEYVYSSRGYLQRLEDGFSGLVLWTANAYDAEMNLLRQMAGNGIITEQTFDPQTSFLEKIEAGPNGSIGSIADLEYAYDTVGNVLSRRDDRQGIYESFDYDDLNRLTDYIVYNGISKYVTYDLTGNILSKSDVGNYTYGPAGGARPHAVQSIAGTLNATYSYDDNGNMTSDGRRTLTWTSYNMPLTIIQGTTNLSFAYNGEHERIKQAVLGSQTTYYLNDDTSGAMVEKVVDGSTTQWNDYLTVGDKMVGVRHTLSDQSTRLRYFVADHLGSISVITNELSQAVERLSFDPWGKRRFDAGWTDDPMGSIVGLTTTRGFTGHEHLDKVGLVHMNARVYDPTIGRFLSADPTIQDPLDSQTLNRYHYARNNPLAFVDPSGYGFFSFFKNLFNKVFKFFKSALGRALLAIAVSVAFYWAAPLILGIDAVLAGVIGGMIGGAISSGDFQGALLGGVAAAFTFGAGAAIGTAIPNSSEFLTARAVGIGSNALMGCVQAGSSGGKCGPSALAGAMTAFAGPLIPDLGVVGNAVTKAALGGASSVVGGGKFKNGAITSAFAYLFDRALVGEPNQPVADPLIDLDSQTAYVVYRSNSFSNCTNLASTMDDINCGFIGGGGRGGGGGGGKIKPINLPSWKNVQIKMGHILERHAYGRAAIFDKKSIFHQYLSPRAIEREIRFAYRYGRVVDTQGPRLIIQGPYTRKEDIQMYFNRDTGVIETAYPVPR